MARPALSLIIPDCHIPYHDRKAFKLLKKVILDLKKQIDELVILGDFVDFYWVSSHQKDPRVLLTLMDEVEEANQILDWIDEHLPQTKKVFLEGNHETRLERYLLQSAPALFGVTESRTLLKLNLRPNWQFVPFGPNQRHQVLGSSLIARHCPPANNPKLCAQRAGCSLIYGHIHRSEFGSAVALSGQQSVAFSPGWLGNRKADQVFDYVQSHHQWQLGFGLVYVSSKNSFHIQHVAINDDYTCMVGGKLYSV